MIGNDTSRTPPRLPPPIEALLAYERELVPTAEMVRARAVGRARESLSTADGVVFAPRVARSRYRQVLYAAAASIVFLAGAAAAYKMLRQPAPNSPSPTGTSRSARRAAPPAAMPAPEPMADPATADEPVGAANLSPKTAAPSRRAALSGKHPIAPEELRLLDRARRADARHDYLGVLAIAAEHQRNHPNGRLVEEREVLRVKALVGLGRGGEARQVVASFRRQFPRSVLRHKIEEMLASLR
jgi:hypothetical protein